MQKKLIDDLLDVSSIITGNLCLDVEPTDLVSVIESAVESVHPAAEAKEARLQTALDPMPSTVPSPVMALFRLDPNRFQQVIWNLVYNAVKFTPSGGSVQVRLVFDQFRQADGSITRKHGGLGLGLAIVRYLVEMYGGTVGVESAGEGQGATFRIKLPLSVSEELLDGAEPPALASQEIVMPGSTPKLSGLRALVVDDQSDVRDLLATILCMKEADVRTAHAGDEDRIRALAEGFQLHLPKPVEPYELVVSVASLTRRFSSSI